MSTKNPSLWGGDTQKGPKMDVKMIKTSEIQTAGQMVRSEIDQDHIASLAGSISRHGLLEPIVVAQKNGDGYQLIAGHHRLLAYALLRREEIPAHIRAEKEGDKTKGLALIENITRKDMTLAEEVQAVINLHDDDKLSPSEIVQLTGHSRAWVDRRLALPSLDPMVVEALFDGQITLQAAEIISSVTHDGMRASILNEAIYAKRTTREIKQMAEIAESTEDMGEVVEAGIQKVAQCQAEARSGRSCEGCGENKTWTDLRAVWICADGCKDNTQEAR